MERLDGTKRNSEVIGIIKKGRKPFFIYIEE